MILKYSLKLVFVCSLALSFAGETKRIMVKVDTSGETHDFNNVLLSHSLETCDSIDALGVKIVEVDESQAATVYQNICSACEVDYAEFDDVAKASFVVDDTYVENGNQWYLEKINAFEGWDITTGDPNVVIAILDSGVNAQHPDLVGQVLATQGYDFVNNDTDASDDFGHGTSVAGTASATTNNGIGIAGIGFNTKVLPVKVMSSTNSALYSNIAKGIIYAADNGARIINLSLTGTSASATLQNAVNYAWDRNCVIICSTGNTGTYQKFYPSACDNVVAVSASDVRGEAPSWSTKGDHVDVVAPGQGIQTISMNGGYLVDGGTSFSAPMVSGLAALIASSPENLSNQEIVNILQETATDIESVGKDDETGFGIINVEQALLRAFPVVEEEATKEQYLRIISIDSDSVSLAICFKEGALLSIQSSSDLQSWQESRQVAGTGEEEEVVLSDITEEGLFIRANITQD